VFAVLDDNPTAPQSGTLQQLVAQRPYLLSNKKVMIFAFDVPYHLDLDVMNKAIAVYGLYSHTDPFVEVAVRTLFGEAKPRGNPPVSVDAIRYDLITQTEPSPDQLIALYVGDPPPNAQSTPVPVSIKIGDTLKVRTGPIMDRNGHIVPDGTQVVFSRTFSQTQELSPLVALTKNGIATVSFPLDRIGPLRVRASSEPAMASFTLQLTVAEQPSQPTFITPTPAPTSVPTATDTPVPPTVTPSPTPSPTPPPVKVEGQVLPRWVKWSDLLLAIVGLLIAGGAGFWTEQMRRRRQADTDVITHSLRWGLWSVMAGLIGYVLFGAGLGSAPIKSAFGVLAALVVVLIWGAVPLLLRWWRGDLGGFARAAHRK
jgi:beta-N-acetylhexosaminidase